MEEKILKQLKALDKGGSEMRLAAEEWKSPFQILISIIMSARTRDETTISVAEKLFKKYSTSKKLGNAEPSEIEKIIRPINFYRNKTKNIIACAKGIEENYGGKVPTDIENLVKLSGVGRKTANVFITEMGDHGIGVDTHVSYISQKLGWTKNSNQDKIEKDLKELFPKKYWNKVNSTLVRFGKTHTSKKQKDQLLEEIREIN